MVHVEVVLPIPYLFFAIPHRQIPAPANSCTIVNWATAVPYNLDPDPWHHGEPNPTHVARPYLDYVRNKISESFPGLCFDQHRFYHTNVHQHSRHRSFFTGDDGFTGEKKMMSLPRAQEIKTEVTWRGTWSAEACRESALKESRRGPDQGIPVLHLAGL